MLYSGKISEAIAFAIQVHEVDQKQKRKGKDIPYIVHPLSVGLILARTGASEDLVAAGILHDVIEDSIAEKKVTRASLAEKFGERVAELVESVSAPDKQLSWSERKEEVLRRIIEFDHDSLLLKSGDIISNATELIDDYNQDGHDIFCRFNASMDDILSYYLRAIKSIVGRWTENPLSADLHGIFQALQVIASAERRQTASDR